MINDDEREMILTLLDCLSEIDDDYDDGVYKVKREVSEKGRKYTILKGETIAEIYEYNGIIVGGFNFWLIKEFLDINGYC